MFLLARAARDLADHCGELRANSVTLDEYLRGDLSHVTTAPAAQAQPPAGAVIAYASHFAQGQRHARKSSAEEYERRPASSADAAILYAASYPR